MSTMSTMQACPVCRCRPMKFAPIKEGWIEYQCECGMWVYAPLAAADAAWPAMCAAMDAKTQVPVYKEPETSDDALFDRFIGPMPCPVCGEPYLGFGDIPCVECEAKAKKEVGP